jgi:hypothetical protein
LVLPEQDDDDMDLDPSIPLLLLLVQASSRSQPILRFVFLLEEEEDVRRSLTSNKQGPMVSVKKSMRSSPSDRLSSKALLVFRAMVDDDDFDGLQTNNQQHVIMQQAVQECQTFVFSF